MSKETYHSVNRDLLQTVICQKRPTTVSIETYYRGKETYYLQTFESVPALILVWRTGNENVKPMGIAFSAPTASGAMSRTFSAKNLG